LFFAKPGEIYNVGSGETVSDYGIAAILAKLQGTSPEKFKPSAVDRHSGEACRLNSYKARFSLKWSNSYSLNEGLYETLKWYKSDDMQYFLT
jgi:dTDP-glucose 4,6-dehydratase